MERDEREAGESNRADSATAGGPPATRKSAGSVTAESETDGTGVPAAEREAMVTIAHGAVVTSGGVSAQRALESATELVLARGLGPVAYGVYALAWRIAQTLVRLVTFGSVPTLQRYLPAAEGDPDQQSRITGLAYATTIGFGAAIAAGSWLLAPWVDAATVDDAAFPPRCGCSASSSG